MRRSHLPILSGALFLALCRTVLSQQPDPTPAPPKLPSLEEGKSVVRKAGPAPKAPAQPGALGDIVSVKVTKAAIGLREVTLYASRKQSETWYLKDYRSPAFPIGEIVVGVDLTRDPPPVVYGLFDAALDANFDKGDFPELGWLARSRFVKEEAWRGVECNVFTGISMVSSIDDAGNPVEIPGPKMTAWIAKEASLPLVVLDGKTAWLYEYPAGKETATMPAAYTAALERLKKQTLEARKRAPLIP